MVAMSVERALQLYIIHGCVMDTHQEQRHSDHTVLPLRWKYRPVEAKQIIRFETVSEKFK